MGEPQGLTNAITEHVANTNGTLVNIKFGEEERRALRWLAPLLIFVGFNFATSVVLYFEWQHSKLEYELVYSHQIKEEAYLAAHGVKVDQFGDPLPTP